MKLVRRFRKGFSLLELAITIAVIAILSAASILTYRAIVNNAKTKSDNVNINELNSVLDLNRLDTETNQYMYQSVNALLAEDIDVFSFVSKTDKELLWNSETKKFELFEKETEIPNPYKYFKIYTEIPSIEEQKYSIYLNNNDLIIEETLNIKVGFDCGGNSHITNISYTNEGSAQEVIIHTRNANLTVNAPNDTIHHYGSNSNLDIEKVSNSSYFEHGSSRFVEIGLGRFVLMRQNSVSNIFVCGQGVTLARLSSLSFPTITRSSAVTSINIQIVRLDGVASDEASISISTSAITPQAGASDEIKETVDSIIASEKTSEQSIIESQYVFRLGSTPDDINTYFTKLQDAFNAVTSKIYSIYLLKNISVTQPEEIVTIGYSTTVTLYLQGFYIKGINCCPLIFSVNNSLTINGGTNGNIGGSLIGDATHDAFRYVTTTTSNLTAKLSTVNTVGKLNCSAVSAFGNIEIVCGKHTQYSYSGNVIVTPGSSTYVYFDVDPTAQLNPYTCKAPTLKNGLWEVRKKAKDSTAPILSATDSVTYYPDFATAIATDKHASLSLRIVKNYSEDINTNFTRAMTLAGGTSSSTNKYTYTGSIYTKGTLTTQYGTFNLSSLTCTKYTCGATSIATISGDGTIGYAVCSAATSNLTINGGTFNGGSKSSYYPISTSTKACTIVINGGTFVATNQTYTLAIYRDYASHVTINGGTFQKKIYVTYSSKDNPSIYTLTLQGGTYKTATVLNTFTAKGTIPEGYHTVTNSDKTCSIVPDEE